MVVVADATPLHYLILIDEIDLLRQLYGTILIPTDVADELTRPQTPPKVREWISALPRWAVLAPPRSFDLPFSELGQGEREAIAIAQKTPNSILLTDDRAAREAASILSIQTVPTIRVLSTASNLGLVDFAVALSRLQQTNFRVSKKVIESLLTRRPLE